MDVAFACTGAPNRDLNKLEMQTPCSEEGCAPNKLVDDQSYDAHHGNPAQHSEGMVRHQQQLPMPAHLRQNKPAQQPRDDACSPAVDCLAQGSPEQGHLAVSVGVVDRREDAIGSHLACERWSQAGGGNRRHECHGASQTCRRACLLQQRAASGQLDDGSSQESQHGGTAVDGLGAGPIKLEDRLQGIAWKDASGGK